jgi:hypothetical protein
MAAANALAYYDTLTNMTVKSFIVRPVFLIKKGISGMLGIYSLTYYFTDVIEISIV